MNYHQEARKNMISNQLLTVGLHDERIIDAMSIIPRHDFVAEEYAELAYFDGRAKLEGKRTMIAPQVFAKMLQALDIQNSYKVLDIGCGTGYSTTVIATMAKEVIGVESIISLATQAAQKVVKLQFHNISIKNGEILTGAPENAPYHAIFVNGKLTEEPKHLLDQLCKGGKLVCILQMGEFLSKAVLFENLGNSCHRTELFDADADYFTYD